MGKPGRFGECAYRVLAALGLFVVLATAAQGAGSGQAPAGLDLESVQTSLFVKINPVKRPWGIIFDDNGRLYVAGNTFEIDRISAAGEVSHFSTISPDFVGPGMAFENSGDLWIADGKDLLKINRFGLTKPVLSGFTRALDIHMDRFGNMLVADDIEGKVYCVTPILEKRVLIDLHLAPMWFSLNGIALDSTRRNVYLAEAVSGRILRCSLPGNGEAGQPEVIAEGIVGLRFLAIDDEDNVYANTHFPILIRIDKDRRQRRFFMENLEDPAGMAFGKRGFDPQSLYITHRYGISKVTVPRQEAKTQ
jgi:hypothetical protein